VRLPIIASAGIRSFDDCREFFWAGADAVSLGSEAWLAPLWAYTLGPLRGMAIRRLIRAVERYQLPDRLPVGAPVAAGEIPAEELVEASV
jgi:dihydroorotate dehydrogenase (NAD+) catalytic subunit